MALALSTKVLSFVTESTVAPAGIPVPVTAIPGKIPTVLATVTLAEPLVVEPPEREMAGLIDPPVIVAAPVLLLKSRPPVPMTREPPRAKV